ncbi:MAG: Kelch repeat-containing protein [Nocardioides sp.]
MIRGRVLLVLAALLLAGCTDPEAESPRAGATALTLNVPRAVHRATCLGDGSVLITGGCTEPGCGGFDAGRTAEVFADGRIEPGAQMATSRASGSATLLTDGRVLLVGGYPGEGRPPTGSAEVYEPDRGRFVAVGDLTTARADHTASLLPDGRVLVADGFDATGRAVATTEVFDPEQDAFAAGPALLAARAAHVAVTVGADVLLVGGTRRSAALATTALWRNGTWRPGPRLLVARVKLGVAALGDGRVLVVGGSTETEGRQRLDSTEVLTLDAASAAPGPPLTQGAYKLDGAVAVLADGRVVIASGDGLDVYDPGPGTMTRLPGTTYAAGSFRTVTPVGDDEVLVLGGYDESITPTDQAVRVRIPRAAG